LLLFFLLRIFAIAGSKIKRTIVSKIPFPAAGKIL
jgi:hypothetical protein